MEKQTKYLESAVVRFAGDSGDGMQLSGTQFSNTAGAQGNDVNTFPDYPSEIRAPEGTLYGVSAYQLQFGSISVNTPGSKIDVLVAMNASSLKVNLANVKDKGLLIVNTNGFDEKNLKLAKYDKSPLDDDTLNNYLLIKINMVEEVKKVVEDLNMSVKNVERTKNIFALGLTYWLFDKSTEPTEKWLNEKFGKKKDILESNLRALKAGYEYAKNFRSVRLSFQINFWEMTSLSRGFIYDKNFFKNS